MVRPNEELTDSLRQVLVEEVLLELDRFYEPPKAGLEVGEEEIAELWRRIREEEADLLSLIRQGLPREIKERYSILIRKRDSNSLAPHEHQELIGLTDQLEHFQAKRVEALADLAELRKIPLDELLLELNLSPLDA
jgi:hypothetical protein